MISDCEKPSRIILGGDSSFNQYEKIFDVLLSAKNQNLMQQQEL